MLTRRLSETLAATSWRCIPLCPTACGCEIVFRALGTVTNPELLNMDTFHAAVKAGLAAVETTAESDTPKKYYRVQVGAYSVKANADAMLKKVEAAGFSDAFVKYSE